MSTRTLTLAEFLLARIEEDEAAARAADFPNNGRWHHSGERAKASAVVREFGPNVAEGDGTLAWADHEHLARHDPARVLAECEAKRRIVDTANRMVLDADDRANHMSAQERFMAGRIAHNLLASLAAVYANHPDYDESWRP